MQTKAILQVYGILAAMAILVATPCRAQVPEDLIEHGRLATGYVLVKSGDKIFMGSSFCIDATGIFVTNHHVIDSVKTKADQVVLVVAPGTRSQKILPATIVKSDSVNDVAILKVERPGSLEVLELAAPAALSSLKETTPVIAFGFPLGQALALDQKSFPATTITVGRVSALRQKAAQLVDIQFDANVTFGNSGGPLLDASGSVIGVVRGGIPGKSINFAVPASYIRQLLAAANLTLTPRSMTDPDVAEAFIRWFLSEIPAERKPVPDADTVKSTVATLRSLMATAYADKSPEGQYALTLQLLTRADETKDDPTSRFVMLSEARESAIASCDIVAALYATSKLTDTYALNPREQVRDVITRVRPRGQTMQQDSAWVAAMGMMLAEAYARQENYAEVRQLIPMIRTAGAASRNLAVTAQMRERVSRLEAEAGEYNRVQIAMEKLKTSPEDAVANLTVGRYRCFVRADFEAGLPMLAKGSDPLLRAAAAADLKSPEKADEQKAVGDQWWDLASKSQYAESCRLRAGHWYAKAAPSLTSLTKQLVEQRLATLPSIAEAVAATQPSKTDEAAVASAGPGSPMRPQQAAGGEAPSPGFPEAPPNSNVVDLLKFINVDRDKVEGEWTLENGVLKSSRNGNTRLAIRYKPPEEYDFRIDFTRVAGDTNVVQVFTLKRRCAWVAGWENRVRGFETVGGKHAGENATGHRGPTFSTIGQRYTSVVRVRKDGIAAYIDGKLVAEHKTDGSDLGLKSRFGMSSALGLGTAGTEVVFHAVELVEVSGKGTPPE